MAGSAFPPTGLLLFLDQKYLTHTSAVARCHCLTGLDGLRVPVPAVNCAHSVRTSLPLTRIRTLIQPLSMRGSRANFVIPPFTVPTQDHE